MRLTKNCEGSAMHMKFLKEKRSQKVLALTNDVYKKATSNCWGSFNIFTCTDSYKGQHCDNTVLHSKTCKNA